MGDEVEGGGDAIWCRVSRIEGKGRAELIGPVTIVDGAEIDLDGHDVRLRPGERAILVRSRVDEPWRWHRYSPKGIDTIADQSDAWRTMPRSDERCTRAGVYTGRCDANAEHTHERTFEVGELFPTCTACTEEAGEPRGAFVSWTFARNG